MRNLATFTNEASNPNTHFSQKKDGTKLFFLNFDNKILGFQGSHDFNGTDLS